jgi:DNA-binding response OmpR family regulator
VSQDAAAGPRAAAARRLLVVEDDAPIREAVALRLRAEGYVVAEAADGPAALAAAAADPPDAVVLDLMLPGIDGLEVCRRLQAERPVPVLMLTARTEEVDRVVGLSVGADDYLTKPFSMRELVARVAALLRRVDRAAVLLRQAQRDPVVRVGRLTIDPPQRRVSVDGAEVHLTPTEFDLLLALARRPGDVWSRERLMAEVWDWNDASGSRTLDSHVKALRRKLGAAAVRTVHGVGYALDPVGLAAAGAPEAP